MRSYLLKLGNLWPDMFAGTIIGVLVVFTLGGVISLYHLLLWLIFHPLTLLGIALAAPTIWYLHGLNNPEKQSLGHPPKHPK